MGSQSDDDVLFGCFFWACGIVFALFLIFMFTVVGPSHTERQERCDAANGVIVKGGACIDRDSVISY